MISVVRFIIGPNDSIVVYNNSSMMQAIRDTFCLPGIVHLIDENPAGPFAYAVYACNKTHVTFSRLFGTWEAAMECCEAAWKAVADTDTMNNYYQVRRVPILGTRDGRVVSAHFRKKEPGVHYEVYADGTSKQVVHEPEYALPRRALCVGDHLKYVKPESCFHNDVYVLQPTALKAVVGENFWTKGFSFTTPYLIPEAEARRIMSATNWQYFEAMIDGKWIPLSKLYPEKNHEVV